MPSLSNILWLGLKEIRSLLSDTVMVLFVVYAFTLAIHVQATGTSSEVNNASIAFVDEDGSACLEIADDVDVVDDLLAHVDRRPVVVERQLDGLHGPLHSRAVAARRGQQHARHHARKGSGAPGPGRRPHRAGRAREHLDHETARRSGGSQRRAASHLLTAANRPEHAGSRFASPSAKHANHLPDRCQ